MRDNSDDNRGGFRDGRETGVVAAIGRRCAADCELRANLTLVVGRRNDQNALRVLVAQYFVLKVPENQTWR